MLEYECEEVENEEKSTSMKCKCSENNVSYALCNRCYRCSI